MSQMEIANLIQTNFFTQSGNIYLYYVFASLLFLGHDLLLGLGLKKQICVLLVCLVEKGNSKERNRHLLNHYKL